MPRRRPPLFVTFVALHAFALVAAAAAHSANTAAPAPLVAQAAALELCWPTPHPAWAQGRPSSEFLQATSSGKPSSGGYGSVRNGGTRFHEGIDIKPWKRDAQGRPSDSVYAALPGVVRHVNAQPGRSSYGRYVVLEHPQHAPAVYTLYAHLASVAAGLRPGLVVEAGQPLGILGRSAGGYTIPQSRAHLHFEIGLRLSDAFEAWYARRGFDSPNQHGLFNGMNLMGFDPLAFYEVHRAGRVTTMADWFAQMRPAVVLRIATRAVPDFVQRYPALLAGTGVSAQVGAQAGWQVAIDASGIPFRWTPLSAADLTGTAPPLREWEAQIVAVDETQLATQPAKILLTRDKQGQWRLGRDLLTLCELLFAGQRG